MIFGYHANGLPLLPPDQVVELLDEVGFGSVALPVGGRRFDPRRSGCQDEVDELARVLLARNVGSIIEVEDVDGSSLIAVDPDQRRLHLKLCEHAIDTAATLRSDCVVLRSGTLILGPDDADDSPDAAWGRLTDSLGELLDYAEERAIPIGFEPTFGMLVDTTDAFNRLLGRVGSGMLRLSLDIATLSFMGELPLAYFLHAWSGQLVNVHLCDVKVSAPNRRLMLGEGDIFFPLLFSVLDETGYSGGVHVRFDGPRPDDASETASHAMRFLRQAARL